MIRKTTDRIEFAAPTGRATGSFLRLLKLDYNIDRMVTVGNFTHFRADRPAGSPLPRFTPDWPPRSEGGETSR